MPDLQSRLDAALSHRYQLERELGRGGMATVWLARDLRHGRRVALKVLHPELAATLGPERFLREIEIAASLAHPHILPLHESGEADGFLYYVMPYVDGESLRDRLRREIQLPVEDAIRIAREVADALGYAHARGLIHRDIKPENILLEAGHAVVADFGVAKAVASAETEALTATGMAVGTPAYMSPEQAGGSDRLDGRSDIYSLGCVLYEMLAGEPPFSAPTPQALAAKHLGATPPQVRVTRATVPVGVERVIERALAKVPADRFDRAEAFAAALTADAELPAAGPPEPSGPQGLATTRRAHGRPRLAIAAIGLVGVAGLAIWRAGGPGLPPLDPDRVVVFPLREGRGEAQYRGEGEAVATYIGYALEGSEPLTWLEGWDRLSERQRSGAEELTPQAAATITRREGARFYIDGSVVRLADSVAVVLRLRDVEGDSLVKRVGAVGSSRGAILPQLGLQAVAQLLPALLEPGRRLDLSALSERKPAAIAAFLQGEREYRRMRFEPALQHYELALRSDSALVLAALKGAQAAHWRELPEVADRMNGVALARLSTLPPRYVEFSRGLHFYLAGDADSALRHFDAALLMDSSWAEAWMARGEVFFHLLPLASPPDSLARVSMLAAARADSTFTPPLLHLAQLDLRDGDTARASVLMRRLTSTPSDARVAASLSLMLECFRGGASAVAWPAAVTAGASAVLSASRYLSVGKGSACARNGFAAVLEDDKVSVSDHWGALLALYALLVGRGQFEEVRRLIDSPRSERMGGDLLYLLMVDHSTGLEDAAAAVSRRLGRHYAGLGAPALWAVGEWAARRADSQAVRAVARAFAAKADSSRSRRDTLLAAAFAAHAVLAEGDTSAAVRRLVALRPTAPLADVEWQPWESLGPERLLLARLLLKRGDYAFASEVAAQFDSPQPVIYSVYLPASLEIRIEAALAAGQSARGLKGRLAEIRGGSGSLSSKF